MSQDTFGICDGADATGDPTAWIDAGAVSTPMGNPVLGTQGGEPYWTDDANGIRDTGEDVLLDANVSFGDLGAGGWYVGKIAVQGTEYAVDSRDYFIDFDALVSFIE